MNVTALMEEYNLAIDDVRWYLSQTIARELVSTAEERTDLVRYIWSGKLESRLYEMEEKYLAELQHTLDQGRRDESWLRNQLSEIQRAKQKRKRLNA